MKSYTKSFTLLIMLLLIAVGCSDQPLDSEFSSESEGVRARSVVLSAEGLSSDNAEKSGWFIDQ